MKSSVFPTSLMMWLVILLFEVTLQSVTAHGSGILKIADELAGPYLLSVWISPTDLKAGDPVHVTISVQTTIENSTIPVLDAEILVQLSPVGSSEPILLTPATTEQSVNKLLYESDMTVNEPGNYIINIIVSGSEGEGTAAFSIEVQPKSTAKWSTFFLIALGLAVIPIFDWVWRKRRRFK